MLIKCNMKLKIENIITVKCVNKNPIARSG